MNEESMTAVALNDKVRAETRNALEHPGSQLFTPPFPLSWPSTGDSKVVMFAYTTQPAPTGTRRSRVWTPLLRFVVAVDSADGTVSVEPLESRQLEATEPRPEFPLAREKLYEAEDALLRAVRTAEPDAQDLALVQSVYRQWFDQNPLMREHLRGTFPSSFFDWVLQP